ncbi:MAG: hypothetical protein R2849_12025 [Thermomicrobiales bacterium]
MVNFSDDRKMRFLERFFLVEAGSEAVDISNLFGVEADWIKGYRWWSPDDIARSHDAFAPGHLASLAGEIARGCIPQSPIRIDLNG